VVSKDIRRILTERARYFNIVLEDVSITQLTFSKEYTAAVEAKQVAQQEAERAKFIVSGFSFLFFPLSLPLPPLLTPPLHP
jgi:prohibitin 2